jgi:hypothetical protein
MRNVSVYVTLFLLAVLPMSRAAGADKPKAENRNAREVVEGYVASALAGHVQEAAALAVPDQSPAQKTRIEEFKELLGEQALKIVSVHFSDKNGRAMAVSQPVKLTKANPDGRNMGRLVFELTRMGDKWLLKDIDFRTDEAAQERVKTFGQKYPDAKEIPAKAEK